MAVDDQGYIVVADSGNNRIQVFTADGVFVKAFGCWGSGDGEFKVNVKPDPITPQATNRVSFSDVSLLLLVLCVVTNETFSFYFLHLLYAKKKKKSIQGLEGIAVMSNGNIVCADRENHRIQVF